MHLKVAQKSQDISATFVRKLAIKTFQKAKSGHTVGNPSG